MEVDGASECLVPAGQPGRFAHVRSTAAVDRLTGAGRHATACLEFRPDAGCGCGVFATNAARAWGPVRAAFRLLADSGFGGERSRGWGRSDTPEFIEGALPEYENGGFPGEPEPQPTRWRENEPEQPRRYRNRWAAAKPHPRTGRCPCSHPPPTTRRLGARRYTVMARGGRIDSPSGSGRYEEAAPNDRGRFRAGRRRARPAAPPRTSRPTDSRTRSSAPASRSLSRCRGKPMRYRLTCLTPMLVGDGHKLTPIDYMVWKDHVNVLDQRRIFRLLAKGPRLDSYLAQLKKADKLDFALGRLRPELRRPPHSVRKRRRIRVLEPRAGRQPDIPTFAGGATGPTRRAPRSRARCAPAWCLRNRHERACCGRSQARREAERLPAPSGGAGGRPGARSGRHATRCGW